MLELGAVARPVGEGEEEGPGARTTAPRAGQQVAVGVQHGAGTLLQAAAPLPRKYVAILEN